MDSKAIPEALAILATSYERDGCPIQAIHCLQSLIQQPLPPDFEAKARLHLGRLLLGHTYNFKEASSNLIRAQVLVKSLMGNYCLKYEVSDLLATCYQYTREPALELQAYTSVLELWKSARGSSEWPSVCCWVCRLAQRTAALFVRCGEQGEAARAAAEGLRFAEEQQLPQQRIGFLLLTAQLALSRWDDLAARQALDELTRTLTQPPQPAAADQSGAMVVSGLAVDSAAYYGVLLHCNVLQVLTILRKGDILELTKQPPEPQPQGATQGNTQGQCASGPRQAQGQEQGPRASQQADADGPDVPPPPVLQNLEATLAHLRAAQQMQQAAAAAANPDAASPSALGPLSGPAPSSSTLSRMSPYYALPGLPSLEPVVCLVAALALRVVCSRPRLTERYLQRGLAAVSALLVAEGVGEDSTEAELPPRTALAVTPALGLQLLLTQCRAQIRLCKAELSAAREDVLCCQALWERFPGLLVAYRPGLQLLTGQYCVGAGEQAAAVAHFKHARAHAASRPAAALAAVLEAEAHLATPPPPPPGAAPPPEQGGAPEPPASQQQALSQVAAPTAEAVGRALAALGPFYMDASSGADGSGVVAGGSGVGPGGGGGPLPGALGYLERAACHLASAACLAQQGQLGPAHKLLSAALKLAHRRLGHTQLLCGALCELAPLFLAENNTAAANEALGSAITFARTTGDLWAEARGKRLLATTFKQQGAPDRALAATASAVRRQTLIGAAVAETRADPGRHGYAVGWGL